MPANQSMYTIGIDEAGRGPLAGPVVVGAVKIRKGARARAILRGIRDSKRLTSRQREAWFSRLNNEQGIEWTVARVLPATIDRINISRAANLAARRAYHRLCPKFSLGQPILLDAGLKLAHHIPQRAIIRGDEKIPAIAAASIIAKIVRDKIMLGLHKKYPAYRFDLHKGYGTKLHRDRIRAYGISPVHRASFTLLT